MATLKKKRPKKIRGKRKSLAAKSKVDIDAEHVEITSAETTDKVAADKVLAAQTATEKMKADAKIAAEVKLEADRTAAEVRQNEIDVAKELRVTEAANTARNDRLKWWKEIILPLATAVVAGAVVAIPSSIAAWRQTAAIQEIRVATVETKELGEETHKLVNSASLTQLKQNASLSRWKAEQTMKQADIEAAEEAERLVTEHLETQKRIDAGKKGKLKQDKDESNGK